MNHNNNKKSISSKKKIFRVALDWSFNIVCFALVLIALLMAIASISRTAGQDKNGIGIASLGSITYAPVATDSMEPTINVGDLVIGKKYDGQELKIGDIITFRTSKDGKPILNTHRIVEIIYNPDESIDRVKTKGDKTGLEIDKDDVYVKDILSIHNHVSRGMGKPIIWLQSDPQHFFLGVVLPIILLFVIYAAIFIRALINAALGKKRLAAATVDGLSEEDKKKLAEEYLAKLESEKKQQSLNDLVASSNDVVKQDDAQAIADTNKDDVVSNNAPVLDDSQKQDDTNTQDSVVNNNEDSKTAEDSSSNK